MKIRILVKEPFLVPEIREVENTLESYQSIVNGYIETISMFSGIVLVVNETGRLDGSSFNFSILDVPILGTVFFVAKDKKTGRFKDLTNKQINLITEVFDWEVKNGKNQ